MNFSEWASLAAEEQEGKCQDLNPYKEWDVFKGVEGKFVEKFGDQPGIEKVHCGLGPCMGPYNSIVVYIKKGEKRTKFPKVFMGFPVLREHKKR